MPNPPQGPTSGDPITDLLMNVYGFDPEDAINTSRELQLAPRREADVRNAQFAHEDNERYARQGRGELEVGPVQVQPQPELEIGPVNAQPVQPPAQPSADLYRPPGMLQYIKEQRAAMNEKASAVQMLKAVIQADDQEKMNHAMRGQLWGAITPGAVPGKTI